MILQGLYRYLEGNYSDLDQDIYTKASMVAVSHSIEKVIKEYQLYADLYVIFQDYDYFLYERERYLEFDKLCRQIFIFSKNIPKNAAEDFSNTVFIELEDNSPLLLEWAVTVVHPDYSAVLATREKSTLQKINKEDYRVFEGFLSLEVETAEDSVYYYQKLLDKLELSYLNEPWQLSELNNKKPKLKKLISLFLNDSLFELEDKLRSMEEKEMVLNKMVAENQELNLEIMQKLSEAAELKDEDSLFHILRIGFSSALIYRELGGDKKAIENIFFASLMHDIGKIGIPDSILLKPGKLTAEEYVVMQKHPEIGARILAGSHTEVLNMAYNIAYSHHEKWNGKGYPQGLKGEEIPLEARIVALADVYDALSSARVYKDAFSREKCVEIVSEQRDQHFEGEILDLFLKHLDEIYGFRRDLKEFSQGKTTREISDYFFSVNFNVFDFLKMREMIN